MFPIFDINNSAARAGSTVQNEDTAQKGKDPNGEHCVSPLCGQTDSNQAQAQVPWIW